MSKIDLDDIRLLDLREVAALVGRSPGTLNDWVRAGLFPRPIQALPGGKKQWTVAIVKAWIARRQRARYQPPTRRGQLKQNRGGE